MESVSQQPVMCEVCGTYFETRRGLSSHARLHLRQLGVTLSESSGAPIELLYQIIQERDGSLPDFTATSPAPPLTPSKKTAQQEPRTPPAPQDRGSSSKAGVKVMTPSLKTASQGSPSSLKESATSLVPSSSSTLRAPESRIIEGGSSSSLGLHQPAAKPLWAPQETDAPLTLASNTSDEVHVCQLCGSWYETRKGLSSHARSHLRQLGIADNETKGSPIELLYKIMADEDLKPIESELQEPIDLDSQPKSSTQFPSHLSPPMSKESLSSSLLQSPPSKRAKLSEVFSCVLCGEEFENRKGLASHSRSHLRQIGVVDLLGNSSAIEAVEELVSSGVLDSIEPHQTNTTTSSAVTSSPAPPSAQVAHPPTSPSASPSPSPALAKSQSPFPAPHLSPSPIKQTPPTTVNRAPKAKKGFRLAVDPLLRKPKPEPIETEMSVLPQPCSNTINSPTQGMPSPAINSESLNAVSSTHTESIPAVLCEFCGQLFDTRKALSCHVRAHLRYLGLTWSVNTSPIDLLKEFMLHGHKMKKESVLSGSAASGKAMLTSQGSKRPLDSLLAEDLATKAYATPLDFSLKEKSPTSRSGTSHPDTSCELCGFDFDNRKALASHCRAHLRQLGVTEWKGDGMSGSPIELLSEIIRKEPTKVAEISRRYRKGDLYIKKSQRPAPSPSISTDSDYVPGSSLKPVGVHLEHRVGREEFGVSGGSSRAAHERSQMERSHTQTQAVRGDLSVRSPRGRR